LIDVHLLLLIVNIRYYVLAPLAIFRCTSWSFKAAAAISFLSWQSTAAMHLFGDMLQCIANLKIKLQPWQMPFQPTCTTEDGQLGRNM
jgi:hypothetical protein